jgi:hypothetical protein
VSVAGTETLLSGTANPNQLWLSSGLEDYFLGAYFHSMPTMHLPFSGFMLDATSTDPASPGDLGGPNSLAAYRIHEEDPVLFTESVLLRWCVGPTTARTVSLTA